VNAVLPHRQAAGLHAAQRVALASIAVSAGLSIASLIVGWMTGSVSVAAAGVEFAGDTLASIMVLVGVVLAARPPDENHPYGHGRIETLTGVLVGFMLVVGGAGIAYKALSAAGTAHTAPGAAALWMLSLAIAVRGTMAVVKFRVGRRIGSTALVADAWNDSVDIVAAAAGLAAVLLARAGSGEFLAADHNGGFAIGLIVVLTGLRVVRDASLDLMDTMPDAGLTNEVRRVGLSVPGVVDVEKQRARKTGLQYHVDLHIEVDPSMTVRESHDIAHEVRGRILAELVWVADVLVHVEPAGQAPSNA
jgi:cation diffusion facilitator family transporter